MLQLFFRLFAGQGNWGGGDLDPILGVGSRLPCWYQVTVPKSIFNFYRRSHGTGSDHAHSESIVILCPSQICFVILLVLVSPVRKCVVVICSYWFFWAFWPIFHPSFHLGRGDTLLWWVSSRSRGLGHSFVRWVGKVREEACMFCKKMPRLCMLMHHMLSSEWANLCTPI